MTARPDLAEIERLLEAATPGPWEWEGNWLAAGDDQIIWPHNVPGEPSNWVERLGACGHSAEARAEANARLIEGAAGHLRALLSRVKELEAALGELTAAAAADLEANQSDDHPGHWSLRAERAIWDTRKLLPPRRRSPHAP